MICNTYKAFFQTLGDGTKLDILFALKEHPRTVTELVGTLKIEQSNLSHQLAKLRKLGFVAFTREGKTKRYALEHKTIFPLLSLIDKHVNRYYHTYCKCKGKARELRWQEKSKGGN